MKVLVTGCGGFIGRSIVALLERKGFEVIGLDRTERMHAYSNVVIGDIRDTMFISRVFKRNALDAVIHCAAVTSAEESMIKPAEYTSINVLGTVNLLKASLDFKVSKFIYISSASVYGNPIYLPIDEEHPTKPINIYGASKLSAEVFTQVMAGLGRIQYLILRLFNVYGPGQRFGVIPRFIDSVLKDKPPIVYGGLQTRDFIHVADVAAAVFAALKSETEGVFNIGSGNAIRILDLAKLIIKLTGKNLRPAKAHQRHWEVSHSCACIKKANKILGWQPQIKLDQGIKEMIIGYRGSVANLR